MSDFTISAIGGTFDIIHKGHLKLLSSAFEISSKVIIGLTSDEMAEKRGKKLKNNYESRRINLKELIEQKFPQKKFQISKLFDDFGPSVLEENVDYIILSDETKEKGKILNKIRKEKNLSPVTPIIVPLELAADGKRISTTRIKNYEIDTEGNLLTLD